jgi:hypothetical protein
VIKNLLSRASPYFGRHVKTLFPAAFAVDSTYLSALGPRGGLWLVLLMCIHVIYLYSVISSVNVCIRVIWPINDFLSFFQYYPGLSRLLLAALSRRFSTGSCGDTF